MMLMMMMMMIARSRPYVCQMSKVKCQSSTCRSTLRRCLK